MIIEQKRLSPQETTLFFPQHFPVNGVVYYNHKHPIPSKNIDILNNIISCNTIETLLLTENFVYLRSKTPEELDDIEALAMAEIAEYDFTSPPIPPQPQENIEEKIKLILKIIIAPFLQKDGGDIELISYNNKIVTVHFLGKCQGCPYAQRTLTERVEKNLIHYLPEIREVILQ